MRKSPAAMAFGMLLAVNLYGATTAGSKVTLTLPKHKLGVVATSAWSGNQYGVEVVCNGPECSVNGEKDWRTSGFPWIASGTVGKTFVDRKTKKTVVEVQTDSGMNLRIVFSNAADVDKGMAAITLRAGESAEEYRAGVYKELAKSIFSGDLAGVPEASQSRLLAFADAKSSPLSAAKYKERSYLAVDMGDDGNVYNTLKMNQIQRVARSLRESIIPTLKQLSGDVPAPSITGVKVSFRVNSKSFLDEYASPSVDRVVMYVPAETLKQFADADISSQKLLDSSVILVNDDRMEISLAE